MNISKANIKLLILGGKPLCSCELVRTAQKLGLYTIVTDYLPAEESPAKLIADEAWDISTGDIAALEKKILEEGVAGIFTGIHEFNIQACLTLCQKLNLPFYSTQLQWDTFSNKVLFRDVCRKYSVPAPAEYALRSKSDYNEITFPVIIKPVDGCASRGISICNSIADLDNAISFAREHSSTNHIIAEQYIVGSEVMIYYYLHNGNIYFTGMCDRHTAKFSENSLQLPNGYYFPSVYTKTYLSEVDPYVRNMLQGEGCADGVFSLQAIVNNGHIYIYEACYRLCGTQYHKFLSDHFGFDELAELIHLAVNGAPVEETSATLCKPDCSDIFFCLPVHITKGRISSYCGFDTISGFSEISDIVFLHHENEQMQYNSHFTQIFCRIYLTARSKGHLIETIKKIQHEIRVYDENHQNMVILPFDTALLEQE